MTCKVGQFDVVKLMMNNQFKDFSINLNAQHVNGMTPFKTSKAPSKQVAHNSNA